MDSDFALFFTCYINFLITLPSFCLWLPNCKTEQHLTSYPFVSGTQTTNTGFPYYKFFHHSYMCPEQRQEKMKSRHRCKPAVQLQFSTYVWSAQFKTLVYKCNVMARLVHNPYKSKSQIGTRYRATLSYFNYS